MIRFALIALLAAGCRHVELYPGTQVQLEIDGETYDYVADQAQWGEEQDRISVYLLPADLTTDQPYVSLRYYSGNPVAHFWLRYGGEAKEKGKWECFVPATLRDGTDTLTWTDDGEPREKTDTGEAGCKVTVAHTEEAIELTWDAELSQPKTGTGGHGGASEHQTAQEAKDKRVHSRGSATITL